MLVLGLILLISGLSVLVVSAWYFDRGRATRRWPKTTGVILASSIQELRARYGFHYTPAVEYQYSVEGREYRGSRIRYGGPVVNGSHSDAQQQLQAYPPGAAVTVFYRPSRPADAVLVPGARGVVASVVLGAFIAFFGGALCVLALTLPAKQRASRASQVEYLPTPLLPPSSTSVA